MEFLGQLHPLVIHFPIVLFLLYTLLEIVGITFNKEEIQRGAYVILILGVIGALAAVLTGHQAEELAEKTISSAFRFPEEVLEEHEWFANLTVWYFFFVLLLRTYLVVKKKFVGRIRYIFIIFALAGTFLVWSTGREGGELVFEHGVGTELIKLPENK
jgi:uncharacterized membrane protein